MAETSLLLAAVLAALSLWCLLVWSPRSLRREKIHRRLTRMVARQEAGKRGRLWRYANRLITVNAVRGDYAGMRQALNHIGLQQEQIPVFYFLSCWLLPLALLLSLWVLQGFLLALVLSVAIFVLVRRLVRVRALQVNQRMNQEAVDLCYLMRMFMESGISLERSMRLISAQAKPLLPTLIRHVDRFNRLLDAGESRQAALQELGSHKDVPVLRDLCLLLKQTSRLGTAAGESLENIIVQAQAKERSRLQEDTNKVSAKMSMVMVLCMLPALMILIGGPAVSAMSQIFQ